METLGAKEGPRAPGIVLDANAAQTTSELSVLFRQGILPHIRAVSGVIVEGPKLVLVQRTARGSLRALERVLHIIVRVPNRELTSWSVYRRERDWTHKGQDERGCVLRSSRWDTVTDFRLRPWERGEQPTVKTTLRYLHADEAISLAPLFLELDQRITTNFTLAKRPARSDPGWSELTIERLLNWGVVNLTWGGSRESVGVEAMVAELRRTIGHLIQATDERPVVKHMVQMYPWSPYLTLESAGIERCQESDIPITTYPSARRGVWAGAGNVPEQPSA